METTNIFDGGEEENIRILLVFKSSRKVKIKISHGKIFGNLDDFACPFIVDLSLCAEKLAIAFLEQEGSKNTLAGAKRWGGFDRLCIGACNELTSTSSSP